MQIDCFITTNKQRPYFLKLTNKALKMSGFNPIIIEKPMLERYFECEKQAKSDIYILCDDDIIPATCNTLQDLVKLLQEKTGYSQIGLAWKENMNEEENNSWIRSKEDGIWEFDHCGGCIAIRKGTIKDLGYKMEFENYGDDRVVGRIARELGYKVGIARNLWFHHLGQGKLSSFNENYEITKH